jgi:hypothetical protein
VVIILQLDLPVESVPITTDFVSSNPIPGEVYLIQHYVIKFANKTDRHDIPEILLKVTLNTIKTTKSDLNREVQNIY